ADTARFPFADPKSIVQMKELEIPLNDSNIKEFEAYKENQYKIADSLDSLSQDLSNIAKEGLMTNDQVFNLFFEGKGEGLSSALDKALNGDFEDVAKLLKLNPEELKNLEAELKQAAEAEGAENPKGADNAKEALLPKEEGQSQIKQSTDLTGHVTDDLHTLLGKEGSNKLADMMREAGLNPSIASKVADGSLSTEDSLLLSKALLDKAMKEEMSGEASPELMSKARELLGSREYKLLLNNGITNEFLMKPEEVADKEKVREYYEKVVKNADKTLEFLNNSGRGATTLAQGMNNLRSNVDFMNQLNNVMTYMQLPLKMNEDKAHGDLYVYTNKKNLAKKDGNVSALLHLDMQHLGTMDIHVQMTNGENVKTHFILQKEEMLDFIGEHLPELDEALAKRGYKMNSDVSLNKEARDVPDIMFNRGANEKLIQTTSFDIRA
ncbi:MAG: flagellar hook-length control protein FliK, partial [Lachnospiraceae bacterium]|nr:flagellar hook-length control protein FliK [Lachnospiraceae bacterium]